MVSRLSAQIQEAAEFVRARTRLRPEVGVILGTGLGDFADALEVERAIPFGEIPHFPVSTVESHAGELVLGTLAGRKTAVMKGRVHFYEGYTMQQVAFPVRVLKALGCGTLVITNACGGMNPDFGPGTIVATTDHINLMGDNPLVGENDESLGPRFPDMSEPYDRGLIALAQRVAEEQGIRLPRGVFVAVAGPNLETAAEYRFLRKIGADVVGMSLVPENLAAVHGGQRVLALSVVTDACNPEALHPVSIPEILAVAAKTAPSLVRLISGVVARLDEAREPAAAAGR
jgi:purine-nucleoside phosphorylase